MSPLLEVEDLHVEIPLPHATLHAVRGVSLTADAGEAVGLVGESGSGKSLTLRALLGLLPQPARVTSGRIVLDGVDVTALPERERRRRLTSAMGMVFQDSLTALNPVMRVGEQIAETPRRKLGMSGAKSKARAIELMDRVGIPEPERRYRAYPHELSGGMRQRICIAIALSGQPRLILADEPTTALDVTIQAQVLSVIESLRVEEGVGLILVSHDLAVVSETCRRIYVMYAGRVVENGPILDVLGAPRHPYSFALLRSVPDPDVPVHRLLTIPGQPPDLMDEVAGCSFADRCRFVSDACYEQTPPLVQLTPDRATACLRYEEAERWSDMVAEAPVQEEVR
ncbi:MAG: Peptide/nickel transport system ATP-binding protein/peptide/nickel transport system ATP-binding [Sphaerisporangium sp.]|jgi:oligopeptide/dipeptide ABC transporter ATP-binding protein|nr:Peptide/nickel transport system ATP-binding protein/peptide/nickel transport system ATP-binding [Sphaerisporangium sp.]